MELENVTQNRKQTIDRTISMVRKLRELGPANRDDIARVTQFLCDGPDSLRISFTSVDTRKGTQPGVTNLFIRCQRSTRSDLLILIFKAALAHRRRFHLINSLLGLTGKMDPIFPAQTVNLPEKIS
jgi:hypothetical protein